MDKTLEFKKYCIEIPGKGQKHFQGTINQGESLALMGPSGCGKSTFLKSIAGLYPSLNGQIIYSGKELQCLPAEQRKISFAFQNPPFLPQYNVLENLCFPLKFAPETRSLSEDLMKRRGQELLQEFHLMELASKDPYVISRGEQQRINLLRALIVEPQILLLDEPLSAIDPQNKTNFKTWLHDLLKKFKTITIIVTHDLQDTRDLSQRVCQWNEESKMIEL